MIKKCQKKYTIHKREKIKRGNRERRIHRLQ